MAVPVANVERAPKAPMPRELGLMLCTLVDEPFDDPDWIFEPKLDGLRVLCRFDWKRAELISRNEKSQNKQFPEVVDAVARGLDRPAVLDGEIVCLDERGMSSFRALQQRFHLEDERTIAERVKQYPAYFYVFDVLWYDGRDVRGLELRERKQILKAAVKGSGTLRRVEAATESGEKLFGATCRAAGEGIIGKNARSPYVPGRTDDWVKIKCIGRQEFVVGGFTDPQRSRVGLGALLVGYYDGDGQFKYAGKVGTGYTKDVLLDLRGRLGRIEQKASPFVDGEAPHGEGVHWVKPKLVAEIAFAEWTQNGLLRQPRFEGLRMDKKATSVKRERAKDADRVEHRSRSGTRRASPAAKTADVKAKTSLDEYARKRDFSKTSEPAPKVGKAHKGEPVFVVQEHDATRRHYDLRLEADGVLKSWAVTKEPSLDPAVKRLAVQTEDHPVEYANFHGDIPEGEYGGGHMEIWDKGTYAPADGKTVPEQMASGKLEFDLHGKKLKGKFAMVRMHGRGEGNWLLIKKKDGEARRGGATQGKEQLAKRTAGPQANAGKAREVRVSPAAKGTRKVTYSHAEKVMFPAVGITKGDVLRYYEQIADVMVPHLKDRPLTLERLPDGVNGEKAPRFWQKNTPDYYPDWIGRARLPSERGRDVNYALVNNRESLLYLVNQGAIVFHVYFSRVQNLERPDFVLFDLDPHQSTFDAAVVTAKEVRKALKTEGVEGYVKTSGKSGIHVVAPWDREGGYDGARAWAAGVAERVVAAIPDVATTERSIRARQGKLYLDVMQNALGHHAVAPYTVRPTETATVSAPLRWEELNGKLDPKKFTMDEVLKRVKRTGDLWQGLVLAGAKGK